MLPPVVLSVAHAGALGSRYVRSVVSACSRRFKGMTRRSMSRTQPSPSRSSTLPWTPTRGDCRYHRRVISDLDALLAPMGTAAFFAAYWEKKPLHLTGDHAARGAVISQ